MKSPFAGTMLESIPPTRQVSLSEAFSGASAQALDLMLQCLQFNPDKRVRAADALKHPYVAEFHNPDDEPDYPHGAIQVRTASMLLSVNIHDRSTLLFQRTGASMANKGLDIALHLVYTFVVIRRCILRVHGQRNVLTLMCQYTCCPLPMPDVQITIDKSVVDDNTKLSAADYREMLYKDINNRRKEARRVEQARQSSGRATAPVNENTA